MKKTELEKYVKELIKNGLTKRQADLVISEYLEADRVGQYSHGTVLLPNLLKRLKERKGPLKIVTDSGPTIYLEGNRELGQLAAEKAVELAGKKAKRYGIAFVGLRNILPFMRPGTYVKKLADQNLFALGMIDGGRPMVAHPNSSQPVIGTNPIAYAIPTARGPLVVDMATTQKAWSEVRHALTHNKLLPDDAYKDKFGRITRNPKKAFSAIPFADYKGFALGMMVEILCGSFLNSKMSKHKAALNNVARSRNAIFIAIDPSKFVSINKFKQENTQFLKEIKSSKRNPGVKKLRIPGESSMNK